MSLNRPTITALALGLTAIILCVDGIQAQELYRSREVLFAPWGSGADQLGLLKQAEGVGPQSLCVDERGDIFILDLANRRVQVFSSHGEPVRQMACGILAHDLRLAPDGSLYLLAPYHGLVEKYDPGGTLAATWPISPDIWLIDGLRIIGGDIIVRTVMQTEYTVVEKDHALEPKGQIAAMHKGLGGGRPERRYGTRWVDEHLGVLQILDGEGELAREIHINTVGHLGSLVFIGEDEAGNIYLRAELLGVPQVDRLKIFKYGPGGDLLAQFTMPGSDYTFVYRSLYLSPQGDVYQLLTDPEGTRVLRWTRLGPAGEGR